MFSYRSSSEANQSNSCFKRTHASKSGIHDTCSDLSQVCHLHKTWLLLFTHVIAKALHDAPCCSMRAGDPPTFKRSAPLSSAARPHAAPGGQKTARRGTASSATQGRSSSAAAGAFLPPQLKGRYVAYAQS